MDQDEMIDQLVAGMEAHDWIATHANDFESRASFYDTCLPCRQYTAAMLRGMSYDQAILKACDGLRDALKKVATARSVITYWKGPGN